MSTEEVPPAYQEVVSALNKAIAVDPVASKKALDEAIKKGSADVLIKQSRDLSSVITSLKKLFENVSLNLIRVDSAIKTGTARRPIWDQIYTVRCLSVFIVL